MDFRGTKSKLFIIYVVTDVRVAISRLKKSVFGMKKIFTHENLKIATLKSITT